MKLSPRWMFLQLIAAAIFAALIVALPEIGLADDNQSPTCTCPEVICDLGWASECAVTCDSDFLLSCDCSARCEPSDEIATTVAGTNQCACAANEPSSL